MSPAARLDTKAFLSATVRHFERLGAYYCDDLDCDSDIELVESASNCVHIPRLKLEAHGIVLCQGFEALKNGWFSELPLHPARGDILNIGVREPIFDSRVVHHDLWVVPVGSNSFRVGATYDRHTLDGIVDGRNAVLKGREDLEERWRRLIGKFDREIEWEVVAHEAAVRPASYDRKPLLGKHNIHRSVCCLNGLGSKGTLMAPALARRLLDAMKGVELDPRLNWERKARH